MSLVENLIKENIDPQYTDLAKRVWTLLYLKPQQYPFFWYRVEVEAFVRPFVNHIQRFCQYFIGDDIQQMTDEEIGEHLPFIMGDDVTPIVLEDMASMNDLIKVHGKALPKFKRTFYELKRSVIQCLYWRNQYLRDIWQECNGTTNEEFYVFGFECGGKQYVFHQPERNFHEERLRINSRLRGLIYKQFHLSPQTEITKEDKELSMADLESRYSKLWLNAQYLLNRNHGQDI